MKRRVLIVEDERAYAAGLADLLRLKGVDSERAATVAAAYERLEAASFDLVTVDLMLPPSRDLEGLELARKLRARGVRTLVLTNRIEQSVLAEARSVADEVVEKGLGGRAVVAEILRLLERP